MDPLTPQAAAVAVGCIIAIYTDVRWGKIYNWTTGTMMLLGLVINASIGDWVPAVMGIVVAFGIHYPLWHLEIQKGGDVKLMMGVGALFGPWFAVEATLWYAIFYVPAALGYLTIKGRLGNIMAVMRWDAAVRAGIQPPGEEPPKTMLRTAPVIAIATFAAFATPWLHFLLFGSPLSGAVSTGG